MVVPPRFDKACINWVTQFFCGIRLTPNQMLRIPAKQSVLLNVS